MTAPLSDDNVHLAPMEDAKSSITTLAMYYYKSMVDGGYSVSDAKLAVMDLLEESYLHYCNIGRVEPKALGTADMRLQKVLNDLKPLAKENAALRTVYDDVLFVYNQLTKKG